MRFRYPLSILIASLCAAVLLLPGCSGGRSKTSDRKPPTGYLFYPAANAYFDEANGDYWMLDSTGWTSTRALSYEAERGLGQGFKLEGFTTPVWQDNEAHRQRYSVALYVDRDSFRQEYLKDSMAAVKTPPKKEKVENKKEEKKKTGVGRFIDKIFGKKDKRDDKKRRD